MSNPADVTSRPVIVIPRSTLENVLEAISIAGLLAGALLPILTYPNLPDRIPMHFGFGGEADAWAGKGAVVPLPIISLVLYLGLSAIRRIPHLYNYPFPVTNENAPELYRLSIMLIAWMKMETVLTFTYLEFATVGTAMEWTGGMGMWFLPFVAAVLTVTCAVYIKKMYKVK